MTGWVDGARARRLQQRSKNEQEALQSHRQHVQREGEEEDEETMAPYIVQLPVDTSDEEEEEGAARDCVFYNDHARLVEHGSVHARPRSANKKAHWSCLLYEDDNVKMTCSTPPLLKLVVRPITSLVSKSLGKRSPCFGDRPS